MKFTTPVPLLSALLLTGCYEPNLQATTSDGTAGGTGDSEPDSSATAPTGEDADGSNSSGTGSAADTGTASDGSAAADSSGGRTTGDENGAPEANDDALYGVQDQPLVVDVVSGLLPNDTDADGDALTVVAADAATAAGGTVVVGVDGGVAYVPGAGFWGVDSFGYTIGDGMAESSASVTVYVAPVLIPLSSVAEGLGGFALDGEAAGDRSGRVSGAGDVNGDGLADLIIGATSADANGAGSGRSYVVFGKPDTATVDLGEVAMGGGGFALDGEAAFYFSGQVSGAGDVNGDGLADLIVGAPSANPNGADSGRSYVVFGKADPASVDLGDVTSGIGGFALDGEAAYNSSGRAVSRAGDVNGDGLADVIIAARVGVGDPNAFYSGRIYVVFGKADTASVDLGDVALGAGGFVLVPVYGESAA